MSNSKFIIWLPKSIDLGNSFSLNPKSDEDKCVEIIEF